MITFLDKTILKILVNKKKYYKVNLNLQVHKYEIRFQCEKNLNILAN